MLIVMSLPMIACSSSTGDVKDASANLVPAKIQVYYFHNERRCATCVAVEEETIKALNELYADKMKNGDITFQSVNLEEKEGEALANKLQVAGQALIVLCGDKQTDLTDKGFMYARSEPAKLKAALKNTIDALK